MTDRDDPILDACLDEVLGGRTPPDLSARIIAAWQAQGAAGQRREAGVSPVQTVTTQAGETPAPRVPAAGPLPPPVVIPPAAPLNGHPLVAVAAPRSRRASTRQQTTWQPLLIAASVLAVGAAVAFAVFSDMGRSKVATTDGAGKSPESKPTKPLDSALASKESRPLPKGSQFVQPHEEQPAPPPQDPPQVVHTPDRTVPPTVPQVVVDPPRPVRQDPAIPQPERTYRQPSPDPEVISFVNATLARTWTESGVTPSAPATDAEWCRRLFVRVLGRIPTVEELRSFTVDRKADKRARLVDRLLTDENYVDEYARHWSVVWSNALIGRTGGTGDSLANREGLEQYLRQSLAKDKPYDQMVRELLTATGSAKPGTEDYNGAVNFLLAGMNKDATLATARVCQVFLGQQLQCAQCHNHPSQNYSQEQFWAMNSFFRQLKAEKAGDSMKLVNVDFGGQGQGSSAGEVFYETPSGLLKSAFPAFVDGTKIPASGDLDEVNRRAELARLVTNSDQLPRSLVNRMWAHFFGYGFTRPIDDMGPHNATAHPELLDRLGEEFAAHHYDLKSAIRWIALCDPFGRSSKIGSLKDAPEAGEVALFSRYYSRQMQAEEVYNSLVQAAQIRKTAANEQQIEKARLDWLAQFDRQMGTDDAMEESQFDGSLRQSLIMMNGDLMRHAASSQQDGALRAVMQSNLKFDDKVEHLFLAALSRGPTRPEQQAARQILKNSGGNESTALEDVWWAVLNSNEFILDH
jgi:hypothetical protein